ncbi:peptidase M50 [Jannaschia ovalis]|uniref:Peptidase M50 n=1 Tax=Jannaschia ovalis TaxID=3038773 RepID=A0ABY8L703_9RHOB|nr:peptidase M50 [Jannaschia sp. GRR-S6-38]WGH77170.1 peptidase M50 [Jannaschia sp. GRR-S6-38]
MATGFESQLWYRVAHLRPRLADRAEITRQDFRGQAWFVLRDPLTGKFCRLSDSAYWVAAQMNGTRTLGEVWDIACIELGETAPTQDELLNALAQLSGVDLLVSDGLPDSDRIVDRALKKEGKGLVARFMNPLALRLPLFDPDRFITEAWPLARPFFTLWGALAYVVLLGWAGLAAIQNWPALTDNLVDRALAAESLIALALVYPVVKFFHELGHGFALKKYGAEVREVGLMFLIFIPVPYVDASAATGFVDKRRRMLVSAAGILVELGLAAIAMLVWVEVEEGLVRAVAWNVMVIGGISTLLFNGNPLLRFDGYFVLSDAIEIPNLGNRANQYLGYLVQRYAFGIQDARSPVRAPGERGWFVFYSIAAFIYRIIITITIVSIVAVRFFAVGVALAIWSVTLMFVKPLVSHIRFVLLGERLRGRRARALGVSCAALLLLILALGVWPVPYRTLAEGVVHSTRDETIYAEAAGTVREVFVPSGVQVVAGQPVLRLEDPYAEARLRAAEAEYERYARRYQQSLSESAYDIRLWRAQAVRAEQELQILRELEAARRVVAHRSGQLVLPAMADLDGRYLNRGDIVGHVVDPAAVVVRVAVHQDTADIVRNRTAAVDMRPAERLERRYAGRIVREVPAVGYELASAALTTEGGGIFAPDPMAEGPNVALQPVMQFDLRPLAEAPSLVLGMRVHVRFDHGREPLVWRGWRRLRQVFLRRFNV